jgi:hypothetical protein
MEEHQIMQFGHAETTIFVIVLLNPMLPRPIYVSTEELSFYILESRRAIVSQHQDSQQTRHWERITTINFDMKKIDTMLITLKRIVWGV